MTSTLSRRALGSSLLIAGMVVPTAAVGSAFADSACPTTTPASTEVAPGICQVVMTESGDFTAPAGISKLAAVLVGGGGGGYHYASGYAGGGGEVTYVDSVQTATAIDVTIGTGGSGGSNEDSTSSTDGGNTVVDSAHVADGGKKGGLQSGGTSGSGFPGIEGVTEDSPGGGARSAATPLADGPAAAGAGFKLSEIPEVDSTLFPSVADPAVEYGEGGDEATESPEAGSGVGGGYRSSEGEEPTYVPGAGFAGASGSVIFRFAAVESDDSGSDTLAETGANDAALQAGALSLGLMVAGAAVAAGARRAPARRR